MDSKTIIDKYMKEITCNVVREMRENHYPSFHSIQNGECSVLFIDNLPQNFSSNDLRRFFSNQGKLVDAYVPHIQKRRVCGRFGFVEVHSRQQGDRLILETNGMLIGRMTVRVQWARYPKRSRRATRSWQSRGRSEQPWNWQRGRNMNRVLNRGKWRPKPTAVITKLSEEFVQRNKTAKVVQLEKVKDNMEWLERSLTCISELPRDIQVLRSTIQKAFPYQILVRDLGKYKFLLTLESKEIKEKLKAEGEGCLKQWFCSITDWVEEDACKSRRLWLEIVGIPIQLWNEQNIKRIAENWGDVVHIEKDTSLKASFSSAKVIIDTLCLNPIVDEAILQVEGKGFRVSVFESKTEYTIIHMGPLDEEASSSSLKMNCPQKVDGRVSQGEVANHDDLEHMGRQEMLSHDVDQDGREGDQDGREGVDRCDLNSNSNLDPLTGRPRVSINGSINSHMGGSKLTASWLKGNRLDDVGNVTLLDSSEKCSKSRADIANNNICSGEASDSQHIGDDIQRVQGNEKMDSCASFSASSGSKTKTAQLSGIGYSEELARLYQGGEPSVDREESQCPNSSGGKSLEVPPGFDYLINSKGGGVSTHLGIDGSNPTDSLLCQEGRLNKQVLVQSTKRVTRSHTKQRKEAVLRKGSINTKCILGKAQKKDSPNGGDSAKTTESMLKLANEALEIGEMLGLKVISKRENAVKRITRSLKSKRP